MNTFKFYAVATFVWLSVIALVALFVVIGFGESASFLVNSL